MIEHTPGPWFFEPEPFDDDTVEITAASREGYIPVATVASAGEEEDPEYPMIAEQRANAHLIAAAPDLLSALIDAVTILERLDTLPPRYGQFPTLDAARAAIAKARGEKS